MKTKFICENCKQEVTDSQKHCGNCGSQLSDKVVFDGVTEDLNKVITNTIVSIDKKIDDITKKLNAYKEFMSNKTSELKKIIPEFESALSKEGFAIEQIFKINKTGMHGDESDLKSDDSLHVELYLKMIGKRKPINSDFKDYDKNGSSKSAKKTREIANTISSNIKKMIPGIGFSINHYSLNKSTGILSDLWVK